jgi:hypothetical protein
MTLPFSLAAYLNGAGTVYKIPPLKANEGYRANDWGDLAAPLWKGRLRIIEKGAEVALYFEDPSTGVWTVVLWRSKQ